jgi:hypothetical protein
LGYGEAAREAGQLLSVLTLAMENSIRFAVHLACRAVSRSGLRRSRNEAITQKDRFRISSDQTAIVFMEPLQTIDAIAIVLQDGGVWCATARPFTYSLKPARQP